MADKFNEPGRAAEATRSAENGESMLSPEKIQEVLTELVKAQEEQRRRIDSLTADNASLRAENQSLREKVDELSKESDDLRRQVSSRATEAPVASAPSHPEQAERTESVAAQSAKVEAVVNNEKPLTSAEVFAAMGQIPLAEVNKADAEPANEVAEARPAGAHFATATGAHFAPKEPEQNHQPEHVKTAEVQSVPATDEIMDAEYTEVPLGKHMAENTGPLDMARNKLHSINHEPQHMEGEPDMKRWRIPTRDEALHQAEVDNLREMVHGVSDYEDVAAIMIAQGNTAAAQEVFHNNAPASEQYRTMGHQDDPITKKAEKLKAEANAEATTNAAELKSGQEQVASKATKVGLFRRLVNRYEERQQRLQADRLAGYANLKSYDKAVKAQAELKKLDQQYTMKGWTPRATERAEALHGIINQLGVEYGNAMDKANVSPAEQQARVAKFQQRWGSYREGDIPSVDLKNGNYGRNARKYNTLTGREKLLVVLPGGKEREPSKEKQRLTAKQFVGRVAATLTMAGILGGVGGPIARNMIANTAKADTLEHTMTDEETEGTSLENMPTIYDRAADAMDEARDEADDAVEAEETEAQARTYEADNLPPMDYHMWGHDNGDGTYDCSFKVTPTSFTGEIDTSSTESMYNHLIEACESSPEQLAIFASQLLSPDQLSQWGFDGDVNNFADALISNNTARADILNELSQVMFNADYSVNRLHAGTYENYGIMRLQDESFVLLKSVITVGEGEQEVVMLTVVGADGVERNIVIKSDCDNVMIGVAAEQVAPPTTPDNPDQPNNPDQPDDPGEPGQPGDPGDPGDGEDPDPGDGEDPDPGDGEDPTPDPEPDPEPDPDPEPEPDPDPTPDPEPEPDPDPGEEDNAKDPSDNDIQQDDAHGFEDDAPAHDEEQHYGPSEDGTPAPDNAGQVSGNTDGNAQNGSEHVPEADDEIGNIGGSQSERPDEQEWSSDRLTNNSQSSSQESAPSAAEQEAANQAAEAERQRQLEIAQQLAAQQEAQQRAVEEAAAAAVAADNAAQTQQSQEAYNAQVQAQAADIQAQINENNG